MKLKANPQSPMAQTVRATKTDGAAAGQSAHFQRSHDFRQMFEVDLDRVLPRAEQPRRHFDQAEMQSLAQSIARRGVLQPVLLQKRDEETYYLVAGERRWRASRMAGKTRIKAVLVDGDPAEIALIENIQRVDLSPLEEARGIAALMQAHGYSQGQAADVLGRSRVRINETLRLLDLPPTLLQEAETGPPIPRTALLQVARETDPVKQRLLFEHAKAGGAERSLRAARQAATPAEAEEATHLGEGERANPNSMHSLIAGAVKLSVRFSASSEPLPKALTSKQKQALRSLRDWLDMVLSQQGA
jgi:ParB family transcriptional regulator, chromosome partitioning protein